MDMKQKAKSVGVEVAKRLFLPTYAFRKNVQSIKAAKQQHDENIVYIKDLIARVRQQKARAEQQHDGGTVRDLGFEEMMRSRSIGAPSIAELERRFRFQKRLAIGTGAAFLLMAVYAISRGNVLGTRIRAPWPAPFSRANGLPAKTLCTSSWKAAGASSVPRYFVANSDGVQRAHHRLELAEQVAYNGARLSIFTAADSCLTLVHLARGAFDCRIAQESPCHINDNK